MTKNDYKTFIAPTIEKLVRQIDEINFLFLIDTRIKKFTTAAFIEEAIIATENLGK